MKRIIMILMILIIASISVSAYTAEYCYDNPTDCVGEFNDRGHLVSNQYIRNGWNLIPFAAVSALPGANSDFSYNDNIAGIEFTLFAYNPLDNKYYNLVEDELSDCTTNACNTFKVNYQDSDAMAMSVWLYVSGLSVGQDIYYEGNNQVDTIKLFRGWNFINVFEQMVYDEDGDYIDVPLNKFFEDCSVSRVYTFDQEWVNVMSDRIWDEEGLSSEAVGTPLLVKVGSDCTIKDTIVKKTAVPPSLPN